MTFFLLKEGFEASNSMDSDTRKFNPQFNPPHNMPINPAFPHHINPVFPSQPNQMQFAPQSFIRPPIHNVNFSGNGPSSNFPSYPPTNNNNNNSNNHFYKTNRPNFNQSKPQSSFYPPNSNNHPNRHFIPNQHNFNQFNNRAPFPNPNHQNLNTNRNSKWMKKPNAGGGEQEDGEIVG